MAAGATYEPIATFTTTSAQSSYTFSSISSSYTDLILVVTNTTSSTNSIALQFNSDTASNYSNTVLQGDGSSASSQRDVSQTSLIVGSTGTNINTTICQIMNYSNTSIYKSLLSRAGWGGFTLVRGIVGLWRNTSSINSIKILTANGSNFNTGATFTLYGIAAA